MADERLFNVRKEFVKRVCKDILMQLLDDLLEDLILNDGEMGTVEENKSTEEMARCLIDKIRNKGRKACEKFESRLKERDPALYEHLELDLPSLPEPPRRKTLEDQQEDNRAGTSQTPTTTCGVTTNKQDDPIRSRMDAQSVYTSLVRGIEEFNFNHKHIPGRLLLTCEGAVPVAVNPSGHVLIAAAQYGKGRVVAMSHASYIEYELADFGSFVQNAINWLKPYRDALVGVCELSNLANFLKGIGINVSDVSSYDRAMGVFCCTANNDKQAEEVLQFVKGGGGLLIAGQAWYWSYENPRDLLMYPGNKVIGATGIVFSSETAARGVYNVPKEIPSSLITDHPVRSRMDAQSVYTSLVRGIEEFNFNYDHIPSRLLLTCEGAVPVAVSPSGHVLIAAAQYGKGRVVAMSHASYIEYELADFGRFVQNAINWLMPHPDALVGVCELSNLANFLRGIGINASDVSSYDRAMEVFCCDAYNDKQAEEVLQFVKGGGGLLIAGQAWYWSYENPRDLLTYPGNKVIGATGIVFSSETAERNVCKVSKEVPSTSDFQP